MIKQTELDKAYRLYFELHEIYDKTSLQPPNYYINNIENMTSLIIAYDEMSKDFDYASILDSPFGWYMSYIVKLGRKYTS